MRDFFIPATARLELDVRTTSRLLAQYRVDRRQNRVDRQRWTAFRIQHRYVRQIPLLTLIERITLFCHVDVFKVTVVTRTHIAVILCAGNLHLFRRSQVLHFFMVGHS